MRTLILISALVFSQSAIFGQRNFILLHNQTNLYKGIPNSLFIIADLNECSKLNIKSDDGEIIKANNCEYFFIPKSIGTVHLHLIRELNSDTIILSDQQFEVNEIPKPLVRISGGTADSMNLEILKLKFQLVTRFENLEIEFDVQINKFSLLVIRENDKVTLFRNITSEKNVYDDLVSKIQANDIIIIFNIFANYGQYNSIKLDPIEYTIVK